MNYYAVLLTALFSAMVLVAGLMRWAPRLGLVDKPDPRKVHTAPIPRVGGLGMVAATIVAILLWAPVDQEGRGFLAAIGVIAAFGVWDDRADLDYRLKFLGQLVAVVLVMLPGKVLIGTLSCLGGDALPYWLAASLTVFFLLGTTNAINLADGLDGLASGLSLLSLACVLALAVTHDAESLIVAALAIVGGTLGFLRYNTHPAMVFMGDTGSQFLGFSLGVLTIRLTQGAESVLAPELPLLILGLPVLDTLTVMTQRLVNGKSPFKADRNHFHHKLLDLGFDHYEAVVAIYLIQSVFVVTAYFLRYESTAVILGVYGALAALVVVFHPLAMRLKWRLHRLKPGQLSGLTGRMLRLRDTGWLPRIIHGLIGLLILVFLLAGSAATSPWAADVRPYAWIIVALSIGATVLRLRPARMLERLSIYTLAILACSAVDSELGARMPEYRDHLQFFFLGLGILIALGVYGVRGRLFALTPSDYLVMVLLLAAAFLPGFSGSSYTRMAMEVAVLLYGIEFMMRERGVAARLLWLGAMIGLSAVGIKAD